MKGLPLAVCALLLAAASALAQGPPRDPSQGPPTLGPLDARGTVTYFISDGEPDSGFKPSDRELAAWALETWARATGGVIRFEPAPEARALVRIHWVSAGNGQYGEMRGVILDGRRGAEVFIRPDTDGLGREIATLARQDPLWRDTLVYLTCVHELGHAVGLPHTADIRDIMYSFGYGGDIPAFFGRYRNQLRARADIARVTGISAADTERVRALYPGR